MQNNLEEAIQEIIKQNAQREALREMIKSSLFILAKFFLGYKDITWATHGQVIEALESPAKRKMIVMPRNTFKSSLACVAFPIWRLLKNYDETILVDSELYTNSKNFLREIRGHLESPMLVDLFGEFKSRTWGEAEIIIKQRTTPSPQASITVGGIGTTKVGQHYGLWVGDDYNSPDNSDTPDKCQKVINHFRYNLNILKPDGEAVIIGTRYSENDVIGWLLRDFLDEKKLSEGSFG